jgi:hypothetical protein
MFLTRSQLNLMVTCLEVELGKPPGAGQLVKKLIDNREWILAFHH